MKTQKLSSILKIVLLLLGTPGFCQSKLLPLLPKADTLEILHQKPDAAHLLPNFNYHQTLTMKLFLSQALYDGQLKKKDNNQSEVFLNVEQALNIIQKIDRLASPKLYTW